jgi:hypothetical protein
MILSESEIALCRELNTSVTDVLDGTNQLFSQADIDGYINNAAKRAWDYKPWTFTEKTYKFTLTSDMITAGYVDYPNTFEDESAFRFEVPAINQGTAEFKKVLFADFQKFLADYPNDTSNIWTEHERFIFFNPSAVSVGQEVDISGKLRAPTLVNSTDLLPFSPSTDNQENSGNSAIILLAYSEALASDKKNNTAGAKDQEARGMMLLDNVWKPIGERRAEKGSQNRPFFNSIDLFNNNRSMNNESPIGNFNL